MPGRNLPTFTVAEVQSHKTRKSCYVTVGTNVYDVTDFLDAHPGGAQFILDFAGKDVADILKDQDSHTHSEAAYEILDDSLIGFLPSANGNGHAAKKGAAAPVATALDDEMMIDEKGRKVHKRTGMANAEDMGVDTDAQEDYKTHKFLDLNRPLFKQIWFGGFSKDFYLDQVHRPRHYKGGESAPLFGNFLEPLTKTSWYVIPILWLPLISYGTYLASQGFETPLEVIPMWLFGLGFWTIIEYFMHRFLFHLDEYDSPRHSDHSVHPLSKFSLTDLLCSRWLPDNRVGITLHFTLHGIHHYLPMDKNRLVMPPTLFLALAIPFYKFAHTVIFWNWYMAVAAFCGGMFGYVCYDCTHYFLHHQNLPLWYPALKKYHLEHHFLDYQNGFGVTTRFWDRIFGTEIVPVIKAQ